MKKSTIFFLSVLVACIANAKVYYVSPDGDNSDGSSWAKAFTSLSEAESKVTSPSEIWVKQGTYEVTATLNMKNGVNVYGGFAGTETSLEARSKDASLTVLSGNETKRILEAPNDLTVETIWDGFTIQKGNDENGGGAYLLANATLQNCIIQQNKTAVTNGGGVYMSCNETDSVKLINCIVRENIVYYDGVSSTPLGGGGIFIASGSDAAVVRGCTIENNKVNAEGFSTAKLFGAGIFMNAGTLSYSFVENNEGVSIDPETGNLTTAGEVCGGGIMIMTPAEGTILVKNTVVKGNKTIDQGGGIIINPIWTGSAVNAMIKVEECFIMNNYSRNQGGGVFCTSRAADSETEYIFRNCVIANNEVDYQPGGGVFINNIGKTKVKFVHCTVTNNRMNKSDYGGAGIYYNAIGAEVRNCIFWGNRNAGESPLKHHLRTVINDEVKNTISYCAFDENFKATDVESPDNPVLLDMVSLALANTGEEGSFVKFANPVTFSGIAKTDEEKEALSKVNWALTEGSACIDTGETIRELNHDIIGTERPYGDRYDIGAYEYDPSLTSVPVIPEKAYAVYGIPGGIVIESETAGQVSVYNLVGALCLNAQLAAGQNTLTIPAGLYIVKVQDNAVKVLVK